MIVCECEFIACAWASLPGMRAAQLWCPAGVDELVGQHFSELWVWLKESFPPLPLLSCSIDKISKVTSPVLVIHGTEDEVIDFSHGLAMYERCPRAVEPLWVEGAGHNDIELYAQYLERLKQFISHELPNSWRQRPTLPHYCEARILVCTRFDWI